MLEEQGYVLKIFIGENDKHDGQPLYEWLLKEAKKAGLAGATAVRGIEGYGAHSRIHTAKIIDISSELPIIVEIIDELAKIENFLPTVDQVVKSGVAVVEKVHIRVYREHK